MIVFAVVISSVFRPVEPSIPAYRTRSSYRKIRKARNLHYSFDKIGLTTAKYTRFSHFVGGILMVLLGLILLVKPTLLVF